MCLITVAPKGVLKTTDAIKSFIEQGMESNTDGSGFACKKKDGVLILEKGFRTSESILAAIAKHKLTKNDELIIHHRIGTSGERNDINMHPFVVSDNMELLKSVKGEFNLPIMAHNGIFHMFTQYNTPYSDTFYFVRDFISTPEFLTLLKRDKDMFTKQFKTGLGGNKLAFLFPDRDLILLGDFKEDEGYFHSNGGYKKYVHDRGGSSAFTNNTSRHRRGDLDELTEDEWNEYYEGKYGASCVVSHTPLTPAVNREFPKFPTNRQLEENKAKTANLQLPIIFDSMIAKAICFNNNDIKITEKNFWHFIIVPQLDFSVWVLKNKGFTIENYDENDAATPVVACNGDRCIEWLYLEKLLKVSKLYVKDEYKENYKGLDKLIKHTNRKPKLSMIKKINKLLTSRMSKTSFRFKEFGHMNWCDLNHFNKTYCKDSLKSPDNEQSEATTMLEIEPVAAVI